MQTEQRVEKGQLTCLGNNLYFHTGTRHYFHRTVINGGRTYRKLPSQTEREARRDLAALETDQARSKLGLVADPYAPAPPTVKELVDAYVAQGCPIDNVPRVNSNLALALRRLSKPTEFFGNQKAADLTLGKCREYARWRKARLVGPSLGGGRSIDAELAALSAVLTWAARDDRITHNPILRGRESFEDGDKVRHCRDRAPKTADDLHAIAKKLFSVKLAEATGWQMLVEAFTGLRTSEALLLRMDAKEPKDPGYIWREALYVSRKKRGTNERIVLHADLQQLIQAHQRWHATRFPQSPWWFPSAFNPEIPLHPTSLTQALRNAGTTWTSHSMRAFYVSVRRSMGILDAQIAWEIGDKSGAGIVEQVYGLPPDNWAQGEPLSWMPKDGGPAWDCLELADNVVPMTVGL